MHTGYNGCSTTTCWTPDDAFISWVDGSMMTMGESRKGAHSPNSLSANHKTKVKVRCWNVRTMFLVGKTAQITAEMTRYGIGILGISECRWSGFGRLKARTGETIIYSSRDDDVHQSGVPIIMSMKVAQCLDSWRPISDRIVEARLFSLMIMIMSNRNRSGSMLWFWFTIGTIMIRQQGKGKVCIQAKWPIRPELIPVSVAWSH